ncbi:MAG: hypothetical protein QXQ65_01090, partial [Conexivisphaerales archaeon]
LSPTALPSGSCSRMLRSLRIGQRSIRKKQLFAHMFAIIDLKDVYLIRKSERNAFDRTMAISHGC